MCGEGLAPEGDIIVTNRVLNWCTEYDTPAMWIRMAMSKEFCKVAIDMYRSSRIDGKELAHGRSDRRRITGRRHVRTSDNSTSHCLSLRIAYVHFPPTNVAYH